MQLTIEAVRNEMACSGLRQTAMRRLRMDGYRFGNASFRAMVAYSGDTVPPVPEIVLTVPMETAPAGTMEAPDERRETTDCKTFVFTSAQSCTALNQPFFDALLRYCDAREAELHVSRFTYNKETYGSKSIKPGSAEASDGDEVWFDPQISPYISDVSLQVTPDLIFCGELNILPTRINPLSSFKNYTRTASGIIPHAKMCMESVPTMKNDPAKFLYTTGTVTARNYIQKAAGQVADFHHVFGALVVEVDDNGTWWARQLNADKSGGFYDLGAYWTEAGRYSYETLRVHAITHGDIHMDKLERDLVPAVWGAGGIVDTLQPREQFFHDTIDFSPRNHHNIKDPHFLHAQHVQGKSSVEREFAAAGSFLSYVAYRPWSTHFIVVSNHDQALGIWLRNTSALTDPENVRFWHQQNTWCYTEREAGNVPHPFTHALTEHLSSQFMQSCVFLQEDDSYKILGEIEGGLHGHLGPNGARGSPKNLRTVGKANTGHTHSAGITEGVYTAGVYGKLDMGYNTGLSSWSHSLIVTYANAKRTILTIKDGKAWR